MTKGLLLMASQAVVWDLGLAEWCSRDLRLLSILIHCLRLRKKLSGMHKCALTILEIVGHLLLVARRRITWRLW